MIIVWKKYCLNLESFLKHDVYYDIDGLNLFSKLIVIKEVMQIDENTPINVLNYLKRLDSFLNAYIAYRILLTICYGCIWINKFFKIKINKILFKIYYVTRKIKWINYIINWKRNVRET